MKQRRAFTSFVERTGRVRSSVMAAAACVVVLAVAVPLVNAESPANDERRWRASLVSSDQVRKAHSTGATSTSSGHRLSRALSVE